MTDKIDPTILKELIDLGDRLTEDRLREIVITEIESNEMDGVAQAYALEEADGDEKKARAYYTKHRVRRIRDLIAEESIRTASERAEKAKQAEIEADKIARAKRVEEDEIYEEKYGERDRLAEEKLREQKMAAVYDKQRKDSSINIFLIICGIVILLFILASVFGSNNL